MSKILLITGGASGIGAATARLAAAEGYSIAINYRSREAEAGKLVNELKSNGVRAIAIQADIARPDEVERLFRTVDTELGTIPFGRLGRVEEIAKPIVWLLSEEASFISGALIDVSGGGFLLGGSPLPLRQPAT